MAKRPAYLIENRKVIRKDYDFTWISGLSATQKRKCALSLQEAICSAEPSANVLEVSTKSSIPLGIKMSAFKLKLDGYAFESVFQSNKILQMGGHLKFLLTYPPQEAKKRCRWMQEDSGGDLIGFRYQDTDFPLNPKTLFYDYIYIKAINETLTADEIQEIKKYSHFTDIEFNPAKSINTQAKAAAEIRLMLDMFGEIPDMTPDEFLQFHKEYVLA